MKLRTTQPRRAGFTMVELLVAMALIVLIMAILGEAFSQGLQVVRRAKGVGDLQDNLRTAVVPLRADLLQRHFDGSEKLSTSFKKHKRPSAGFFRLQQGTSVNEGSDGNGLPSNRASQDLLHMTIIKTGNRRSDYMTALAPNLTGNAQADPCRSLWTEGPSDYNSNWSTGGEYYMNSQRAELMWFLVPMPDGAGGQMTAGTNNTPLYTLHRRQKLIVTDNNTALNTGTNRVSSAALVQFPEIAAVVDPGDNTKLYFPTLKDYDDLAKRSMMAGGRSAPPTPLPNGEDRVIADVISFEMKILMEGDYRFKTVSEIQNEMTGRFATQTFPGGVGVLDTADWPVNDPNNNANGNPNNITLTVKAVEIIIRVWDQKTEQTRQITVIQDM